MYIVRKSKFTAPSNPRNALILLRFLMVVALRFTFFLVLAFRAVEVLLFLSSLWALASGSLKPTASVAAMIKPQVNSNRF